MRLDGQQRVMRLSWAPLGDTLWKVGVDEPYDVKLHVRVCGGAPGATPAATRHTTPDDRRSSASRATVIGPACVSCI